MPPTTSALLPSAPSASVLVAVRVRPFSQREKEGNARLVVQMPDGRLTELRDPRGLDRPRQFIFDHSYWSHDGFRPLRDGYLVPLEEGLYADQKKVFDDLGRQVLKNAWAGYNCTLFAYGQTGSGKSYSIIGFGQNRGIVPQLCDELFRGIGEEKAKEPKADFQVSLSMLEIYCEKVRDLLGEKGALKGGLRVREHPQEGFYVEGLATWPVGSYREVERQIAQGTRMRTIAATNLNETSSRAHTIVRLEFSQRSGKGVSKRSEINLVDLAGSERQKKAQGNAERQKEGIRINLSLSTLGRVIQALHEGQQQRRAESMPGAMPSIPYRDSVLTALLRNALGGNSKTIMIAAISPADVHYEETLSTLRFADRVKQIKTRPVVNEAQTERLVRALKEENGRLMEILHKGGMDGVASEDELEALRRQLAENQREMERLERSWTQREEALKKQLSNLSLEEDRMESRRKEVPHLWNLNEDTALTNVIVHFVDIGESRVGNGAGGEDKPQILMRGLSIQPKHALLRNKGNRKVMLLPMDGVEILVNGSPIRGERELQQNDRVHFGGNHLYVFVNPQKKGAIPVEKISFEMAQKEIAQAGHLVDRGKKSKEDLVLEEELVNLLPYVYRANSMAKELKKNVTFELVLLPSDGGGSGTSGSLTEVWVKMQDLEEDSTHLWDSTRFMNRYYGMQEVYQNYVDGGGGESSEKEKDPFHESSNSPIPLGTATFFLQNLAYLVEQDEQVPIIDLDGLEAGHLSVSLRPCSSSGRDIVGECVEGSKKLIGKDLGIKVKLLSAIGLPRRVEKSCCKYRFFDQEPVSTPFEPGPNPVFAHERVFLFKPFTQQLLDYLTESALVIEVSAIQRCRQQHGVPELERKSNIYLSNDSRKDLANGYVNSASSGMQKGVKKRTNSVDTRKSSREVENADGKMLGRVREGSSSNGNVVKPRRISKGHLTSKTDEASWGKKTAPMASSTLPRRKN